MDLALRTLREGKTAEHGAAAPLLLLRDELAAVGGPALLRHAVTELAAAIEGGRAQAVALTVVCLQHPADLYSQQLSSLKSLSLTVLDCFSDSYGWGSLRASTGSSDSGWANSGSAAAAAAVLHMPGVLAAPDGLQQLQQHLLGGVSSSSGSNSNSSGSNSSAVHGAGAAVQPAGALLPPQLCLVVFDSLTPLLDAFGASAVAHLLHSLAAAPSTSSLLCMLHHDLHAPPAAAAIEQLAAGSLSLQPASELERSVCAASHGRMPQGRLAVRLRRRSGRVRAEDQLYCIDASGGVAFLEPSADLLNPAAAAEKAVAAAAGGSEGALAQQLAGGMKLSLTQQELEARQRVQLPFEHQGQGAAYQTGDWRDYLPPEAGGRAASRILQGGPASAAAAAAQQRPPDSGQQPGQPGQLGRILYVRDSASEHDSDEDPDDDLDI